MQSRRYKDTPQSSRVDVLVGNSNPQSRDILDELRDELTSLEIRVLEDHSSCKGGEALIAMSYGKRVPERVLSRYASAVVVHASALPAGRGWSPANWMLENLETSFTISLIQMVKEIDEGPILGQRMFELEIADLWKDFQSESHAAQKSLLREFLRGDLDLESSKPQQGASTHFRKRVPADSELDPEKSLAEQWGKIRAADSSRYPNFFSLHGQEFVIEIKKRES